MTSTRFAEIAQLAKRQQRGVWTSTQLLERVAELEKALAELIEFARLRDWQQERCRMCKASYLGRNN